MLAFPKKDSSARVGSNLPCGTAAPLRTAGNSPLLRLEREFRRERAKLLRPADRRAAEKLARTLEAEWQRAALAAGRGAERRQQLKATAKEKLARQLARSIPGFRAYRTLRKSYLQQRAKLGGQTATTTGGRLSTLDLGALGNDFTADIQEFVAPFPRYEILTGDLAGLLRQDDSLIWPDNGQWVQNFSFEHNESSWGVVSHQTFVDHLASCGVDFTLPREGRLQIGAELENFANRLNCSISDNFGFSHCSLEAAVNLFIAVVRQGQPVDYYPVRLISSFLYSGGDDLSGSISDLDTFEPYAVGALTLRSIPAGEQVTVLAGTQVHIDSDTDDMDAHVRATYWWKLRKLQIAVV